MFYDITAHTLAIALITAGCLIGTIYPGKSEHTRHLPTIQLSIRQQRSMSVIQQNGVTIQKKNLLNTLFNAIADGDSATTSLILSSSKDIDTNKKYQPGRFTLLHIAVMQKSPVLAALLLSHPKADPFAQNALGTSALDMVIRNGSHTMIKTFTHRDNFDPTQRDETGESTINKLARRNKFWAKKLCQNVLINRLKTDTARSETASNPNDKKLECMICLQTAAEICQGAKINPLDAQKKPEQLMSITTCCHGLLCTRDKKRWLNTSRNQNCPTCRKPLQ